MVCRIHGAGHWPRYADPKGRGDPPGRAKAGRRADAEGLPRDRAGTNPRQRQC